MEGYFYTFFIFMATPDLKTRALHVLLGAAIVAVAAWYSPFIGAVGWHIFHPRGSISYRGMRVLVPWPWTAAESDDEATAVSPQGLALKRTPYTMDRRLTNQSIFVTVISPETGMTAEQQHEAWLDAFRATHPGAAFDSRTPVKIPAGTNCLSARSHWTQSDVVWTCISVEKGWVADFEGHEGDAPAFFRIVGNLKP